MEKFESHLDLSLKTGFKDASLASKTLFQPHFVRNNHNAGIKVLSYISQRLESCDEFWFSAAFLTTSGMACLHNALKSFSKCTQKRGKIYVSDYLYFTDPEALRRINTFSNIEVRLLRDQNFHGKGYLFKIGSQFDCLIGSSNLTSTALSKNDELNIHLTATAQSKLVRNFLKIFDENFNGAAPITEELIDNYNKIYKQKRAISMPNPIISAEFFLPNSLQMEAMKTLADLRKLGSDRALVVSATGTGKTVLAAFDVKAFEAKKLLFVVHRLTIAKKAMKTFEQIFGDSRSMGLYSGQNQQQDKDFIFSTVQTINSDQHRRKFNFDHFDYIIFDETHRAGAKTYQKILDYFTPKFLLGMTATPERSDQYDIFSLFNHQIGCEIRLHRAMDEELLCPFHYFGISDISVDGKEIDNFSDFNLLVSENRINHIIKAMDEYGTDSGLIRGLVFCSHNREAEQISTAFNKSGFKSIALSGKSSEFEREEAIRKIESSDLDEKIDYIFTVDIFNEGIDIPSINQILMLRPTQSAIIFIQQLGRGLRRADCKEYLTVIDFIGNYQNNYLIPVALYGDRSFNKDNLRHLVTSKSSFIPGESTVNFDEITTAKIFDSINLANLEAKKDLMHDYRQLKSRLGRRPMMIDFNKTDSREPYHYVKYSRSLYNFAQKEDTIGELAVLPEAEKKLLEHLAKYVNDGVRGLESLLLIELIENKQISRSDLIVKYEEMTDSKLSMQTLSSALNCLNLTFHQELYNKKYQLIGKIYNYDIAKLTGDIFTQGKTLQQACKSQLLLAYIYDSAVYSLSVFKQKCAKSELNDGFIRYAKYTRIDVMRVLNWHTCPYPLQNVGGYKISADKTNCPIFVTYEKSDNISETTKYNDEFLSPDQFSWMTRSNRTLKSPEVMSIISQASNGMRLPLFIKKSNDEGIAHYYIGDLTLIKGSVEQQSMLAGEGRTVSIVNIKFTIDKPVEDNLYEYLTG